METLTSKPLILLYPKFEFFVSQTRLDRFFNACGNDTTRTQNLYQANLKVAESFYSILNFFEIFLRNRINHELSSHFSDSDWIITEKNGFMNHKSLTPSKFYLKKQVENAERKVTTKKKPITSSSIIAEQSLGFWTSLYDTHHYKLLSGSIIHCFPNKPTSIQRKQIHLILEDIRDFRNRIYHNEPICFNGHVIDFARAIQVKDNIYNVLDWMDSDIPAYTAQFDNIVSNIHTALQI